MKNILIYLTLILINDIVASDVAFYNPSLVNLMEDKHHLRIEYETKQFPEYSVGLETQKSNSITDDSVNLYYVSPSIFGGKFTFVHKKDFSAILNSSWDGPISKQSANNFELTTLVTQLGYTKKIENLSIYAGLQRVYKRGKTKALPASFIIENDADGENYGGLLSISYRFKEWLFASVNYSSQVDVKLEGTNFTNIAGTTSASTTVEHPAKINAYIFMYTSKESLWILSVGKKYWSAHSSLDITYGDPTVETYFGAPVARDWNDIMIYKFGHRHTFDNLHILGMVAYAEDMVPDSTRDFSLSGGDITALILRADYNLNEMVGFSFGYKYIGYDDSNSNLFNTGFSTNGASVYTFATEFKF